MGSFDSCGDYFCQVFLGLSPSDLMTYGGEFYAL
jgi:hypothetical protein